MGRPRKTPNVRNRTAVMSLHLLRRFRTTKPERLKDPRTIAFPPVPSFQAWQLKAPLVSISAANGHHALVVLLVEDEFIVRYNAADWLRDAGYVVVETASGEEAIGFCQLGMSIDIVFTDINLTGAATGWDVAECFRTQRPSVPVIYTSGKLIDRSRCVPGSGFVPKPYNGADILKVCQQLRAQ